MDRIIYVRIIIVIAFLIPYVIFTAKNFRTLQKDKIFKRGLKLFHMIMIWLVPFIWIWLLKVLSKRTPGSYEIEKKEDPKPFPRSAYGKGI